MPTARASHGAATATIGRSAGEHAAVVIAVAPAAGLQAGADLDPSAAVIAAAPTSGLDACADFESSAIVIAGAPAAGPDA